MKAKRILCLLLSAIIIIGVSPITRASEDVTAEGNDIYHIISTGIGSAEDYLGEQLQEVHNNGGVSYGFEWYIISMLRAGKVVDSDILDEYYASVSETVKGWGADVKPTDVEKVALALAVMDKNITDVEGVDLISIICNSEKLGDGANELAYALIAIYASGKVTPNDAKWNERDIIDELLGFQATDGGFGLSDDTISNVDITAICVQALAPYKEEEAVKNSIDKALTYLSENASDKWNYADNPNSTAQVLLALATLGIDVTNPSNGFGNSAQENIITALEKYRNTDGSGYVYSSSVNSMATVQVMQAYDAYRKTYKEGIQYWDFGTDGQAYDDEIENEETKPEEKEAEPADIYVTIVDDGKIVADKNGEYVAQAKVTVTDFDKNGTLTVDEALHATHERYYDGGAEAGYSTFVGDLGLSLAVLWGKGTPETTALASYYLNNISCWSLNDTVKEGDYLTAFNYFDAIYWSDAYSYFNENEVETQSGETVTLTLNYVSGYDATTYAPIISPCSGAKVELLGDENSLQKIFTTDKDGKVKLSFTGDLSVGKYYVMAYKDDNSIVPTVCKINVTAGSGGDSGGSVSRNISVYIRVADPEGNTYLEKTGYSVRKGTSVYELLRKTELNIKATESAYGVYIKAIEGLGELDEGEGSGWMYRVNGNFSDKSASLYSLSDGDFVEWLYTRDLGEDLGDNSYSGSSSVNIKPKEEKTEDETDKTVQNPIFTENIYNDIKPSHWYYNAVKYAYENNLMQGMAGKFAPDISMTREMLVTVLWRLEKQPIVNYLMTFDDVQADEWYTEAIRWAASEKIILGEDENNFGVNKKITREQIATILMRYIAPDVSEDASINSFDDEDDVSAYAADAMKWAVAEGIINGTGNKLLPTEYATRAQVATMIMRFCEAFGK